MKKLIATAAVVLMATTASAADAVSSVPQAPVAAEVSPSGFDWTGGYAGIQTGYAWLDGTFDAGAAAGGCRATAR
ncbi:hypothetical protein [Rhizobium sp. AG855]|uniref:hypothetical protein n=1 Tax=Rhizobium sp. AG855 TaxID=2183898 RepID=UPI001FE20298|nr:hypothetical protein [Rhizobium sp. AG855]